MNKTVQVSFNGISLGDWIPSLDKQGKVVLTHHQYGSIYQRSANFQNKLKTVLDGSETVAETVEIKSTENSLENSYSNEETETGENENDQAEPLPTKSVLSDWLGL